MKWRDEISKFVSQVDIRREQRFFKCREKFMQTISTISDTVIVLFTSFNADLQF
jgi:hypothetical protein